MATPTMRAHHDLRYQQEGARQSQAEEQQRQMEGAYARDRLAAIAKGVPESALHPVKRGMDVAAAAKNLSFQTGGRGNASGGPLSRASDASELDHGAGSAMGQAMRRNADAESAANSAVAGSTVPLNANSQATTQAGALAASRQPTAPAPTGNGADLIKPDFAPGHATNDQLKTAVARNLEFYRNPTAALNGAGSQQGAAPQPTAPLSTVAQNVPRGTNVSQATSDALFGPVKNPTDDAAKTALTDAKGGSTVTNYGTAGVRYAQPGEKQTARVDENPEMDPSKPLGTGPQHAPQFDEAKSTADIIKRHPNLMVAGSPENIAFNQHKDRYGAQNAHENVDSILERFNPGVNTAGATAQGVKNDIPNGEQESRDARVAALVPPKPPESLATRAGKAINDYTNKGADLYEKITSLPDRALDFANRSVNQFVSGVQGAPVDPTAKPVTKTLADVYDWATNDERHRGLAPAAPEPRPIVNPIAPPMTAKPTTQPIDNDFQPGNPSSAPNPQPSTATVNPKKKPVSDTL